MMTFNLRQIIKDTIDESTDPITSSTLYSVETIQGNYQIRLMHPDKKHQITKFVARVTILKAEYPEALAKEIIKGMINELYKVTA